MRVRKKSHDAFLNFILNIAVIEYCDKRIECQYAPLARALRNFFHHRLKKNICE